MSTITANSTGYVSQNAYASTKDTTSQAVQDGIAFSYDTTDEVIISSQGQQGGSAPPKLELYQPHALVGTKVKGTEKNSQAIEELLGVGDQNTIYDNHVNVMAKLMGISAGMTQSVNGTQHGGVISPNLVYQRSTEVSENLDQMIGEKLNAIGVSLGKDEILNFSVDQDGVIKVDGKHIKSEQTRAAIEKAFNEDADLARELKFSHALRKYYTIDGESQSKDSLNYTTLLTDCYLEREFGVSIDDLELRETKSGIFKYEIVTKDGSTALFNRLYDEDRALYSSLISTIKDGQKQSFTFDFTYQNGVLLEEGETDPESLRKTGELYMNQTFIGASRDYSITIDENGRMMNSTVTRHSTAVWGVDNDARTLANDQRILTTRFNEASQSSYDGYLVNENPNAMGIVFQHYGLMELLASDSKRAMQYIFGVDSSQMKDFSMTLSGRSVDWFA